MGFESNTNSHLNIFKFYSENDSTTIIENNLSRAFAITLKNNPLFLNEYIKSIVTVEDYEYLFNFFSKDSNFSIDLQVDIASIKDESYSKIYAIAMTSDSSLDMVDFLNHQVVNKERNITDVLITIKDIAFIIEVKRTNENCKEQLFNQIHPFLTRKDKIEVVPVSFSWQDVVKLMEKNNNLQKLLSRECVFIQDFLQLSELSYPDWFESKPFYSLSFSSIKGSVEHQALMKRMKIIMSKCKNELLSYGRLGLNTNFSWASELIPEFELIDGIEVVNFYIWPGNTKTQGYSIYYRPMNWLKNKSIVVDDKEYKLEIEYNIKFSHFNRFVSEINFCEEDVKELIHTKSNFENYSGKWERPNWNEFETFLDKHILPHIDWRQACKWNENFLNTDRNYFTVSFGFMLTISIPFSEFKTIDRSDVDIPKTATKIDDLLNSLSRLI